MTFEALLQSGFFNWVAMPILIIIARILDVSMGTIRVVMITKGMKYWATLIGFFEVLIWIVAIRQIFVNVDNPLWLVAYAVGFALGTYIGIQISERLSINDVLVRVITKKDAKELIVALKEKGYGFTIVDSAGKKSKGKVIFSVVHSSQLTDVIKTIRKYNPKAFFTIEDVRKVNEGQFKKVDTSRNRLLKGIIRPFRKGK